MGQGILLNVYSKIETKVGQKKVDEIQMFNTGTGGHALLFQNKMWVNHSVLSIKEIEHILTSPVSLIDYTSQEVVTIQIPPIKFYIFEINCCRICQVKHNLKPCLCGCTKHTPFYKDDEYDISICHSCIEKLMELERKHSETLFKGIYFQFLWAQYLHPIARDNLHNILTKKLTWNYVDTPEVILRQV